MRAGKGRDVAVIGLGNWGSSLAVALEAVPGIAVERVHASPSRRTKHPRLDASLLWICVPDAAITSTAKWLAAQRRDMRGQVLVHSSGALDREVLIAAERAGARTASVHPMMSFPTRRVVPLKGARFGVEAVEVQTRRFLFQLIRQMGAMPFAVEGGSKAIYHAGAMFGSPLLVAALDAGMREAGIGESEALALLGPMAAATVANVQRLGMARSFSGPLARGDGATVKLHRQALAGHPLLARVYDALAGIAVKDLPSANRTAVRAAMRRSDRSTI